MGGRLLHKLKRLLLIACVVLLPCAARAQTERVLVVANTDDSDLQLTRLEVRNLFMGGDSSLNAIALTPDNMTRVLFNTKVIGLTESRIQAYWAQMRFSGRKR